MEVEGGPHYLWVQVHRHIALLGKSCSERIPFRALRHIHTCMRTLSSLQKQCCRLA